MCAAWKYGKVSSNLGLQHCEFTARVNSRWTGGLCTCFSRDVTHGTMRPKYMKPPMRTL